MTSIPNGKHCFLADLVDNALGPSPYANDNNNANTIWNWYRLVHVLVARQPEHPARNPILEKMTAWHHASFRMLYEWWTASYQDSAHSLAAIIDLLDSCGAMELESQSCNSSEIYETVVSTLSLRHWPMGNQKLEQPNPDLIGYHNQMKDLFDVEFNSLSGWRSSVRMVRRNSAMCAFCQQSAWQFFHATQGDDHGFSERRRGIESKAEPDPVKIFQATFGIQSQGLAARGPVVEVCPWLKHHDHSVDFLPYYLWDVKHGKTVETSELESHPTYTAVSHTWGRWTSGSSARVTGIPWDVPQNTRFDVNLLSTYLRRVPTNTPYVWFDLCCIPQDGSIIGAREISRQAKIFQGAQYAVAWLNDVDDFTALQHALNWQVLQVLHLGNIGVRAKQAMRARIWDLIAGKQTGLLQPRTRRLEKGNEELNPWFSSLWTLQELALRPDIWLCTKSWDPLTCDGKTPLPFSGILTIVSRFLLHEREEGRIQDSSVYLLGDQNHVALYELQFWYNHSGLDKFLQLSFSQATLLMLGDRRECTERRAEAIMSVLGCTRWYNDAIEQMELGRLTQSEFWERVEQDLILDKYPSIFVQEICESIMGDFFCLFTKPVVYGAGTSTGSLLPFSRNPETFQSTVALQERNIAAESHSSVSTWKVLTDGTVFIRDACIVGSTTGVGQNDLIDLSIMPIFILDPEDTDITAGALPPDFKSSLGERGYQFFESPTWRDLNAYMRHQTVETYAVLVKSTTMPRTRLRDPSQNCMGMILKRTSCRGLAKTNHFWIRDEHFVINLDRTERVNWVIR